jgi:hypothetical protein
MPRAKRTQNADPNNDFEISKIKLLDATMPYDNGLTNNQVRAAIREARAKINEIINILNAR